VWIFNLSKILKLFSKKKKKKKKKEKKKETRAA
jgi:hypothetical protein